MAEAHKALDDMGVECEVHVSSAHRTPERTGKLAREAAARYGPEDVQRVYDARISELEQMR